MFLKDSQRILIILILSNVNYGFILHHTHKNHMKDNANEDFSINFDISDEDYEMISEQDLVKLNMHFEDYKTHEDFDRLVKNAYEKDMNLLCKEADATAQSKSTDAENQNTGEITPIFLDHIVTKRDISNIAKKKVEYASNKIIPIFRALELVKIKECILSYMKSNCTIEDTSGIGPKTIKCLIEDYIENPRTRNMVAGRLCKIALTWLLLYLVVAIPLWCTKGWCCCCLCCKFFKPQETIQEAKTYLLLNPPGTLVTKRGGIIHYEPTEREKDCYEEFGHFIRTL